MNLSNHFITTALNCLTDNGTFTSPTTLYLALLDEASAADDDATDPTDQAKELEEGTATQATPVNGYKRQVITSMTASSGGSDSASGALLTFGPSTTGWAAAGWGWIVDHGDGGSGNIWMQGPLLSSKTATADDSILFAIGEVIFQLA